MNAEYWRGRRVFITGHTGFKGAWLCLWLRELGAQVCGYSLAPPTNPSLFELANAGEGLQTITGDVRDLPKLSAALAEFAPNIVLHMAAQSVVLTAQQEPADTFSTNVMGTVNLLEAVRCWGGPLTLVNVTTDKVYLNQRWAWPYRETDALGGLDPYSNSKACSELVTQSYARSYFPLEELPRHGVALATARAGNVIGGGDWTPHQLIPAVVAAAQAGEPVKLRNPSAVRPWQHVLDCLQGYLTLAEQLQQQPLVASGDWNFGPSSDEIVTVAEVAEGVARNWQIEPPWVQAPGAQPKEEHELRLDCSKAARLLPWRCELNTTQALDWVAQWQLQVQQGASAREVSLAQIAAYTALLNTAKASGMAA
jgi:CDP-glucose 4,6-dehydratase